MKNKIAASLLLITIGMYSSSAQKQYYTLEITNSKGQNVVCKINGFNVVNSLQVYADGASPIDAYLSGKNELEVIFKGKNAKSWVNVDLRLFKGEENIKLTSIKLVGLNAYKKFVFTSEDKTFGTLTDKLPVIPDKNEVKAYAMYLLKFLKSKDIKNIVKEMQAKINDFASIYNVSAEVLEQNFLQAQSVLLADTTAKSTDIKLTPMCKGKIYEIRLGNKPFFSSTDKEGGSYALPVYVGKLNGTFGILR